MTKEKLDNCADGNSNNTICSNHITTCYVLELNRTNSFRNGCKRKATLLRCANGNGTDDDGQEVNGYD